MTLTGLAVAAPDLLRLLAVPIFAWTAWCDVKTRRVTGAVWIPLAALGLVLLAVDGWTAWQAGSAAFASMLVPTVISLGIVGPLAYLFWWIGGFGGADAKAILVLALLFPSAPRYVVGELALPLAVVPNWAFSFTILSNAVVVAVVIPLAIGVGNALAGRFTWAMLVGWPLRWERVETTHGRLLDTPTGRTRSGLDLDALRMYLCWRGCTLAGLRADPEHHRDPASLPDQPGRPTDGAVVRYLERFERDASAVGDPARARSTDRGDGERAGDGATTSGGSNHDEAVDGDPWGAAAFLDDVDGTAYGTDPATLRDGLDVLVERETVWVSPGTPFIVPIFTGLLLALTVGDLLLGVLA